MKYKKELTLFKSIVKIVLLSIVLLTIRGVGLAQAPSFQPEFVSKSPSCNQFPVFGNTPIGLYTGVPNISIPLGEYIVGNLKIPITLSYNGSGVRVPELSGAYGINWSLNAGGIISCQSSDRRKIRESPDPQSLNYWNFVSTVLYGDNQSVISKPLSFFFSTPTDKGKFYISENQSVWFSPQKDYLINKESESYCSYYYKKWTLLDPNGIVYTYETPELSDISKWTNLNREISSESVRTAFYLDRMYSPDSVNKISIQYEPNKIEKGRLVTNEIRFYDIGQRVKCPKDDIYYDSTIIYSKVIKTIINNRNNCRVDFNYKDNIDNNYGSKLLDNIVFYDENSKVEKKYIIRYLYNGRYNISSIEIFNKELQKIGSYDFVYEPGQIPPINSFAMDYYGYFNGKAGNNTCMAYDPTRYPDGSNRQVDTSCTKYGVIKEIKYPTGGRTIFEFENNKVTRDETVGTVLEFPIRNMEKKIKISPKENILSSYILSDTINLENNTVIDDIFKKVRLNVIINGRKAASNDNYNARLSVDNISSNENFFITNNSIGQDGTSIVFNGTKYLSKGVYVVTLETNGVGDFLATSLEWSIVDTSMYNSNNKADLVTVAGLRVKEIKDISSDQQVTCKKYKYDNGILVNPPYYDCPTTITELLHVQSGSQYERVSEVGRVRTGQPIYQLGTTHGSFVSYERVKEFVSGNGFIEYIFTNSKDIKKWATLKTPGISMDHRRGLLKEIRHFDNLGNVLSEEWNSYEFDLDKIIYGTELSLDHSLLNCICYYDQATFGGLQNLQIWSYEPFETIIEFPRKTQTLKTNYYRNIDNKLSFAKICTKYYYKRPKYTLIDSIVTTGSDGKIKVNKIKYSFDYNDNNVYNVMKNKNQISSIIENDILLNNKSISFTKTMYQKYMNGGIYPAKIEQGINNKYLNTIIFKKYDIYGNCCELIGSNGVNTCYLWGYNNLYPIAKLDNITYDNLAKIVDPTKISQNYDNLLVQAFTDNLRSIIAQYFKNVMINTYTYCNGKINTHKNEYGEKQEYIYDNFDRLSLVKNEDKAILNQYTYRYYSDIQPEQTIEVPKISVNPECLSYQSSGGSQNTLVTSNTTWSSNVIDSWLSCTRNGNTLTVNATPNPSGNSRIGKVEIIGAGLSKPVVLSVSQEGATFLDVDSNELIFDRMGGRQYVFVNSSSPWSILSTDGFVMASKKSEQLLEVSCGVNSLDTRTGSITLSNGIKSVKITVTQYKESKVDLER
jgi:hypothetical protein